jgi:hypothetical protein
MDIFLNGLVILLIFTLPIAPLLYLAIFTRYDE